MFEKLNILEDNNKILRKKSKEVTLPLSNDDKTLIKKIIEYLTYSQIKEKCDLYNLRPGMGLAFPQLGLLKRIIVVVNEVEENTFENYAVINPQITSYSVEKIAASGGEGCLSVNREVEGHVLRYARVTIEGFDEYGNKVKIRAREELSIAFQHEIDHLDGILFYDHIDKNKKFYTEEEIRLL